MSHFLFSSLAILCTVVACGGSSSQDANTNVGSACKLSSDCASGQICLSDGKTSVCAATCQASANECGASASCAGVGALSLDVCQPKPKENETPAPEEQKRIPCSTDAECQRIEAGSICAQWQGGEKDCTIPCTDRKMCNPALYPGFTTEFMDCATDLSNSARKACLPDPKCFQNAMSCITMPGGF